MRAHPDSAIPLAAVKRLFVDLSLFVTILAVQKVYVTAPRWQQG